jgi:WD40 repeat protein
MVIPFCEPSLLPFLHIYSSFSPTDTKLATCSEDGTVRTFDFIRCAEEFILRGVCVTLGVPIAITIHFNPDILL